MESIQEGHVYRGRVRGIKNFGAFIAINGGDRGERTGSRGSRGSRGQRPPEGLCHVSQISSTRRIESPEDVLRMNEEVWVKVIRIHDGKISLSMKGIDQRTGEEQVEDGQVRLGESYKNGESRGKRYGDTYDGPPKRKSTMDAWELNQMRQAYGVKRSRIEGKGDVEDPFAEVDSEEEPNKEEEEDVEIQLNGTVPPFLAGKLAGNSKTYQPQKAARIPDGSLERIAQNGSRFMSDAREKKMELRKQVERARREKERDADPMKSSDVDSTAAAAAIQAWKRQSRSATYGIRSHKSIREQRESLPVFAVRAQLLNIIKEHDMTVIVGETGSGKTTQITQYLAESGYGEKGIVACTQPRRVAAISVAKRVSEEVGCKLGDEVGYQIRFEDCTTASTIIKYMTDGMLEREALVDPDMLKYSIIMLDEAHERTVATDVLFALLRDAVRRRKGSLKLIITSATLDSSKFSHYFDDCPVFHIEGRTFPVKIYYTKQPEKDYIEAAIDTVMDIHVSNPPGDILVFLTGREEIETCCETIVQKMSTLYKSDTSVSELIVLPIYSAMPSEMQSRIFEPTPKGKRKVVIATNIAETSITIDGIYYVVDPGFVKVNAYDAKLGMDSLIVQPISKAQADQRSGRAGRTGPGICYRLYTKKAYEREMAANTVPEILRQNLSNTVLMLKAMGIEDVVHFGFMDRPKEQAILAALQELYILDALDSDGRLTRTGKYMSYFPMEPLMSKTMIQSVDFGCSYEVMVIIAMLSVPDVFYRPREQREKADKAKQQFDDYTGDHLTLLNVYEKWEDSEFSRTWCSDHYVHEKSMRKARDVKIQLGKIMGQLDRREGRRDSSIISCKGDKEIVIKAFVSGYFKNCAKRVNNAGHYDEEGTFRTLVENTPVHIHPSSALFRKGGIDYVMYHTLILTNQEYMQCVTKIDARWLVKYAPRFYKQAAENELSLMKKREKIEPLWNRFDQGQEWRLSRGRR